MFEDAGCNNPCGAEPMGCGTCDMFGTSTCPTDKSDQFGEHIHKCRACACEFGVKDIHGVYCPECESEAVEYKYCVAW